MPRGRRLLRGFGKVRQAWFGMARLARQAWRGWARQMKWGGTTDDEIMRALCCGRKCAVGPNTGYCHRWDFTSEAARIRALLDQHGEMPTCMDRASEPGRPARPATDRAQAAARQTARPGAPASFAGFFDSSHIFDGPLR